MKSPLIYTVALASLLVACSSVPLETKTSTAAPMVSAPTTSNAPAAKPMAAPVIQATPEYLDPGSLIYKQRSVFFDFDLFTIKSEFTDLIERHAKYLKAHPELEVKLEGNADERGGREYNVALGQKRSEAVKRALVTLGAGNRQLEAVSLGEEKPRMAGHDEASWAANRRVDFVYATKK